MWKRRVVTSDDCYFQAPQAGIFIGTSLLVEVDGSGNASSPAVAPFVSFSAMSSTNETCAGLKTSREIP
jgi:hypothetical protein